MGNSTSRKKQKGDKISPNDIRNNVKRSKRSAARKPVKKYVQMAIIFPVSWEELKLKNHSDLPPSVQEPAERSTY